MIHPATLLHVTGRFLLALAGTMLIPLFYGLRIGDDPRPFAYSIAITGAIGLALLIITRRPKSDLSKREGVFLVLAIWIVSGIFGCLPFYLSPYFSGLTNAFFETVSGFTTTGATILPDVEVLPQHVAFSHEPHRR